MHAPEVKFNCQNCAFRMFSLNYVTTSEYDNLAASASQLKYSKGEIVLKQGAKSSQLVFLHRGIVKLMHTDPTGKNLIVSVFTGPQLIGVSNLFFRETNFFSLVAAEDCDICLFDCSELKKIMLTHPEFAMLIFEQAAGVFESAIKNFISLANKQVNGRIADMLLFLSNEVYGSNEFILSFTRKELAEYAACSQENVISILSKMDKENIVSINGKNVTINNKEKLAQMSLLC